MTPQELAARLASYTPQQLGAVDHATLFQARDANAGNMQLQQLLAPYEHRAFAREATRENPLMAVPIALATPLYAGAKAAGFMRDDNTTDPSMKQVAQGLTGVGEGLWGAFQDGMKSIQARTAGTSRPTWPTDLLESLQKHLQGSSTSSTNRQ